MKIERTARICLFGLLALSGTITAQAGEEEKPQPAPIGTATQAILQLQRDGSSAGQAQPITGDVASRSYKRYLESFTNPMPESRQPAGTASRPATNNQR